MKNAKKYLRQLKREVRELLGMLSIRELLTNKEMVKKFELVDEQLIRWS